MPDISIVIPVKNEQGNIAKLLTAITEVCAGGPDFEIVVVDDASSDGSAGIVQAMAAGDARIRLLRHDRGGGQSAAVHNGVAHARGRIVCTLDGDGQNPPEELPRLYAPFLAEQVDGNLGLVAGQRLARRDSLSKKLASSFANGLRQRLLRDGARDTGCGLKAFRRDRFLELPYFDHMHRYLPALFRRAGYEVHFIDVGHRPRAEGRSNYSNLQRGLVGIIDLVGVMWLLRRGKKAMAHEDLARRDGDPR